MRKIISFGYGLVAYAVFFFSFLYAIGFVGNVGVPKSIDDGLQLNAVAAIVVNALLLTLFAMQHSIMARPWFKRWWTRFVPVTIERSTYVLFASCVLLLLFALWRPLPATVWEVTNAAGVAVLWSLFAIGWLIVLLSTFMIGHFDLFGLKQVWVNLKGRTQTSDHFRMPALYGIVRHPIMLGFLIAFWSTPVMSVGHLLFSIATTAYILVAVQLEERDLIASHGESYRRYKREVPAFFPRPRRRDAASTGINSTPRPLS